ncbi:unnamed protein product [Ostreobium quekettii]|uniref:RNA-editing substrate-binding complex 6 protein domain-containing protein n=1 Tax=Ostreobium quekettii TaxID=121088 RepID=A0A8S1JEX4_9CHLO|nr:unnamed protein product [Ostreobium quekettii]
MQDQDCAHASHMLHGTGAQDCSQPQSQACASMGSSPGMAGMVSPACDVFGSPALTPAQEILQSLESFSATVQKGFGMENAVGVEESPEQCGGPVNSAPSNFVSSSTLKKRGQLLVRGMRAHRPSIRRQHFAFVDKSKLDTEESIRQELMGLGGLVRIQHVALGFHAAQRLKTSPSQELLIWLSDMAMKHMPAVKQKDLAIVFFSVAKLRYLNPELMEAMGRALLVLRVETLTTFNLSNIVYSQGLLQRWHRRRDSSSPREWYPSHRAVNKALAAMATSSHCLRFFSAVQLSQVAFGLSNLDINGTDLWAAVAKEITEDSRLGTLSSFDLCNVLQSLARVGFKGDDAVRKIVGKLSEHDRLAAVDAVSLSSLFYSLRRLQCAYWDDLGPICRHAVSPAVLSSYDVAMLSNVAYSLGRISAHDPELWRSLGPALTKPSVLAALNEQQLCNALHGLMLAQVTDEKVVLPLAREATRRERSADRTPQGAASAYLAISKLGVRDPDLVTSLVRDIIKPGFLRTFHVRELLACLFASWCLSGADIFLTRRLTERVVGELLRRRELDAHMGSWALHMLTQMGYRDQRRVRHLFLKVTGEEALATAAPEELVSLAKSMARLECREESVARRLAKHATRPDVLARLDGRAIGHLMSGLAALRHAGSDVIGPLAGALAAPGVLDGMTGDQLAYLLQSCQRLGCRDVALMAALAPRVGRAEVWRAASPCSLVVAARCLGAMGFDHPVAARALVAEAVGAGRLVEMGPMTRWLVGILCAMPALGLRDRELAQPFLAELGRCPEGATEMTKGDRCRLGRALQAMGFDHREEGVAAALSARDALRLGPLAVADQGPQGTDLVEEGGQEVGDGDGVGAKLLEDLNARIDASIGGAGGRGIGGRRRGRAAGGKEKRGGGGKGRSGGGLGRGRREGSDDDLPEGL